MSPRPDVSAGTAWLDASTLCRRFNISRSKLERDIRNGSAPQPVKLGRVRRWSVAEVERYEARLLADRGVTP